MRIKFTIIALFIGVGALLAQTNILFLGNSYTYTYNTDQLVKGLAQAAGENVYIDMVANPGQEVEGATGHAVSTETTNAINSRLWDYVVIQDQQGRWIFPPQNGNPVGIGSATGNAAITLYNTIKARNPCTKIVYFAGWSSSNSNQQYNGSLNADIDVIYVNHVNFSISSKMYEIVAPIGKCWKDAMAKYPSVNMFYSDGYHPNLESSYLCAASIFVSIFKLDPQSLNYVPSGMSSTVAANFRKIAWDIQMQTTPENIYGETQMDYNTPSIASSGGVLTAGGGYNEYRWYRNGILLNGGTTSVTHKPTQTGTYRAEGEWNGCWFMSFEVEVTTVGVEENELSDYFTIYPNPTTGVVNIENVVDVEEITVSTVTGEIVMTQTNNNAGEMKIDLSNFVEGVYFVKLVSEGNVVTKRVLLTK